MKREPTRNDFDRMAHKLGKMVFDAVVLHLKEKKGKRQRDSWTLAYLDARWTTDRAGRISKLRIALPGGKLQGIHTTDAMEVLLNKVGKIKDEVFAEKWFGLKVTVFPDRRSKLDFNLDPECYVDPHWYET